MGFILNPFTGAFDAVTDPSIDPFVVPANCLTSDSIGDCVYIRGDAVGGLAQVTKADPTTPLKMPAIGIILTKSSAILCAVAYFGVIPLSGLLPNARYFVSATGQLSSSIPGSRPVILQVVGQALDSSRLLLTLSRDLIRLNA